MSEMSLEQVEAKLYECWDMLFRLLECGRPLPGGLGNEILMLLHRHDVLKKPVTSGKQAGYESEKWRQGT